MIIYQNMFMVSIGILWTADGMLCLHVKNEILQNRNAQIYDRVILCFFIIKYNTDGDKTDEKGCFDR